MSVTQKPDPSIEEPPPSSLADSEFPPQVYCAHCGLAQCAGCAPHAEQAIAQLAWEGTTPRGPGLLWTTTCQTVNAWRSWLPELSRYRPGQAWVFALLSELLASVSLCALGVVGLWLLFPDAARDWAVQPQTWLWLMAASAGFALFMVGLHASWACSLELLLRLDGRRADTRSSLCLGLYACGWDLLTSPAGLLLAVATLGPRRGWHCVRQAAVVPRHVLDGYLIRERQVAPARAMTIAVTSFVASVLTLVVVCGLPLAAIIFHRVQ